MPDVTHQQAPSTPQPQADFLRAHRQFDEPLLSVIPHAECWRQYQAWRSWFEEAVTSGKSQCENLRNQTINAYWDSVNSGLPPPNWTLATLSNIEQILTHLSALKFLLNTTAGDYLFIHNELGAEEAGERG